MSRPPRPPCRTAASPMDDGRRAGMADGGKERGRVLVTGATGRLGRALVPELTGAGFTVRAMSRQARPAPGAAFRAGPLTTAERPAGTITWKEYLTVRY